MLLIPARSSFRSRTKRTSARFPQPRFPAGCLQATRAPRNGPERRGLWARTTIPGDPGRGRPLRPGPAAARRPESPGSGRRSGPRRGRAEAAAAVAPPAAGRHRGGGWGGGGAAAACVTAGRGRAAPPAAGLPAAPRPAPAGAAPTPPFAATSAGRRAPRGRGAPSAARTAPSAPPGPAASSGGGAALGAPVPAPLSPQRDAPAHRQPRGFRAAPLRSRARAVAAAPAGRAHRRRGDLRGGKKKPKQIR